MAYVKHGGELKITGPAIRSRSSFEVLATAGGGFLALWAEDDSPVVVRARSFDSDGTEVGHTVTLRDHDGAAVIPTEISQLKSGGFAAIINTSGNGQGVNLDMFDASGHSKGHTIVVAAPQEGVSFYDPSVATLTSGRLVVSLVEAGSSQSLVLAQIYRHGMEDSDTIVVSPLLETTRTQTIVQSLTHDHFICTWLEDNGLYGQIYDGNADSVGEPLRIDTVDGPTVSPVDVHIESLKGGAFVTAWASYDGFRGAYTGLQARFFVEDGATAGAEITVSQNHQYVGSFDVAALKTGGCVIAWAGLSANGERDDILAQVFDDNGRAQGSVFRANTESTGAQFGPKIEPLSSGGFVISWTDAPDPSRVGGRIKAQIFDYDSDDHLQPTISCLEHKSDLDALITSANDHVWDKALMASGFHCLSLDHQSLALF